MLRYTYESGHNPMIDMCKSSMTVVDDPTAETFLSVSCFEIFAILPRTGFAISKSLNSSLDPRVLVSLDKALYMIARVNCASEVNE